MEPDPPTIRTRLKVEIHLEIDLPADSPPYPIARNTTIWPATMNLSYTPSVLDRDWDRWGVGISGPSIRKNGTRGATHYGHIYQMPEWLLPHLDQADRHIRDHYGHLLTDGN